MPRVKEYGRAMIYDMIGIGLAMVVGVIQALILRAVPRVASPGKRAALLAVKLPLWAGFFIVLAKVNGRALLAGGIASGIAFPAAAWLMFHTRQTHKPYLLRQAEDTEPSERDG